MVILNIVRMFNTCTFNMQIPFFVLEEVYSNSGICEERLMSWHGLWRKKQIQMGGEFYCTMFVSSRILNRGDVHDSGQL